jgi:endo-1,4-beta-xylanase
MTGGLRNDPVWQGIVLAQFNQVTIDDGLYWSQVEPIQGVFHFGSPDLQAVSARSRAQRVRGHPLVWAYPDLLPTWISDGSLTAAQLADAMTNHVTEIVSHYRGQVAEWIVVNEPGVYENDPFARKVGPQYLQMAFAAARAADPDALLILNNYDNEAGSGANTAATRAAAEQLAAAGLVDRVGLQMHLDGAHPPDAADVGRTMQSYPVPVCVTEFDIDLSNVAGTQDQRWATQASIAASMLKAVRGSGVCTSFTLWGIGDPGRPANQSGPPGPVLATPFDSHLQPKPFFQALLKGLA